MVATTICKVMKLGEPTPYLVDYAAARTDFSWEAARAELEATNARASLAVLTETLAGMNPNETLDTRVSVRALLEHAQEKLQALNEELVGLNAQVRELEETIAENMTQLLS